MRFHTMSVFPTEFAVAEAAIESLLHRQKLQRAKQGENHQKLWLLLRRKLEAPGTKGWLKSEGVLGALLKSSGCYLPSMACKTHAKHLRLLE